MHVDDNATIYAVKAIQPTDTGGPYWVPKLYEEIQHGNARFGWS